jgi:hypothetical protein
MPAFPGDYQLLVDMPQFKESPQPDHFFPVAARTLSKLRVMGYNHGQRNRNL